MYAPPPQHAIVRWSECASESLPSRISGDGARSPNPTAASSGVSRDGAIEVSHFFGVNRLLNDGAPQPNIFLEN